MLGGFLVLGYSYMNDIKESKGRKSRKKYPLLREDGTIMPWKEKMTYKWVKDRVNQGDKNFTKFLEKKERAHPHH